MDIVDAFAGLVARALPTKTVDSIISVATKIVTKLAAAEAAQNAKAKALREQAAKLTAAANAAEVEAHRAAALGANFSALTRA